MFSFEPVVELVSDSLPYIFIDKVDDTFHFAIQEIASNSVIAVDCEGS